MLSICCSILPSVCKGIGMVHMLSIFSSILAKDVLSKWAIIRVITFDDPSVILVTECARCVLTNGGK